MNKNPFSIYDFLGYLFPGLMLLVILLYVSSPDFDIHEIFNFEKFVAVTELGAHGFDLDKSIMIIIVGYVIGHFISYVSSITIEQLANSLFGYPSAYLLHGNNVDWRGMLKRYFLTSAKSTKEWAVKLKFLCKIFVKLTVFALLMPISTLIFTVGWLIDLNSYVSRQLDDYLANSLLQKQNELLSRLHVNRADVNRHFDYHRIVMHYVYINIPNCQRKVDNYISLYGFLRAISFVFCLCFDLCLFDCLKSINLSLSIDWLIVRDLATLYAMACLSFLGFMKFYRRCSLENYMALLSEHKE